MGTSQCRIRAGHTRLHGQGWLDGHFTAVREECYNRQIDEKIKRVHTAIFKMDNQQGPTVQHRELCWMLCGSLDGRGVWGRMNTYICVALHCPPGTITALLISYTPMQNKEFKKKLMASISRSLIFWLTLMFSVKYVVPIYFSSSMFHCFLK